MVEPSNRVQILVACAMQGTRLIHWTVCNRQNNRNGQPYQCVCNIRHTDRSDELFVIRECNRNSQPDQVVCDIRHTIHSDKLFSVREHNRNGSTWQDVCDMRHIVHMDELFAMSQKNTNESCKQDVCDTWETTDSDELFATTQTVNAVTSCAILCVQKTLKNANYLLAVAEYRTRCVCEYSCAMISMLHIRFLMLTCVWICNMDI